MADRDATFREALDAYDKARDYLRGLKPNGLVGHQLWAERQVEESRARVLALYAERQGEVYEVVSIYSDDDEYRRDVVDVTAKLSRGDKVRVTKVEEGP